MINNDSNEIMRFELFDYYGRFRSVGRIMGKHIFLIIYLIITLFPFFWAISTSFKTQVEIIGYPPSLLPSQWTFENYYQILFVNNFVRYLFNSIFIAFSSVSISIVVSLFAGFAMSRYDFPGKELLLFFMLGGMAIGRFANVIPLYFFATKLGLYDTYFILILANTALVVPLLTWLMLGYFRSIPKELDEAAKLDGCNSWVTFWRILVPTMKPAIVAGSVIALVNSWNEFILAMTLTRSSHLRVLSVAINFFKSELGVQWGQLCASSIFATLPIVIVVVVLQKYFIQGLTSGSLGSN